MKKSFCFIITIVFLLVATSYADDVATDSTESDAQAYFETSHEDSMLNQSDILTSFSERFLRSEIGVDEFLQQINELQKKYFFDSDTQMFFLSVIIKKFPDGKWPQQINKFLCHLRALQNYEEYKKLNVSCKILTWNLKDIGIEIESSEILYLDGQMYNFRNGEYPIHSPSGNTQIYIVSDTHSRFIDSFDLQDLQNIHLVRQRKILSPKGDIKKWPAVPVLDQSTATSQGSFQSKRNWVVLGLVALGSFFILKDKEIIIEK